MDKNATTTTRKRGRPKNPEGRKRFWWIGTHVSEPEKLETKARAAREKPGRPFSEWMRARIGLPEKPAE